MNPKISFSLNPRGVNVLDWDLIPKIVCKLLDYKIPRPILDSIVLDTIGRNELNVINDLLAALTILAKEGVDDRELYELIDRAVKSG
jgi:hypothetical protein